MITIKDVAKHAGVSTATASRALHNVGYVKKETLDKVLRSAKELGFVANVTAQQLKSSLSDSVGIIVSDVRNEYYWHTIAMLQSILKQNNKQLVLAFSSENPIEEEKNFRYLIACRVSVIIFTPTSNSNQEIIDIAIKNGIRVLQLYRDVYPNLSSIINDDENGCYQATKYLIYNGCKKLLLIDVDYEHLNFDDVAPSRSVGFINAIKEHEGLSQYIIRHKFTKDQDSEITEAIQNFKPDGIIAGTNLSCLVVLEYLVNHNLNTQFITFDDNQWLFVNKITAIKQDNDKLVDSLLKYINLSESVLIKEKVPCILVQRSST